MYTWLLRACTGPDGTPTDQPLQQVVEKPHAPTLHLAPSTEPMLAFERVQFRYTPQRPILQELSFEVGACVNCLIRLCVHIYI